MYDLQFALHYELQSQTVIVQNSSITYVLYIMFYCTAKAVSSENEACSVNLLGNSNDDGIKCKQNTVINVLRQLSIWCDYVDDIIDQ